MEAAAMHQALAGKWHRQYRELRSSAAADPGERREESGRSRSPRIQRKHIDVRGVRIWQDRKQTVEPVAQDSRAGGHQRLRVVLSCERKRLSWRGAQEHVRECQGRQPDRTQDRAE